MCYHTWCLLILNFILICTSDKIYYCKPKILYAAGRLLSSTVFSKVSVSLVSEAYAKYLLSKHSAFREHLNWEVSGLPGQQRKGSWHFCWTEDIFQGQGSNLGFAHADKCSDANSIPKSLLLWNRVSLCSSGWLWTGEPPAASSWTPWGETCATLLGWRGGTVKDH